MGYPQRQVGTVSRFRTRAKTLRLSHLLLLLTSPATYAMIAFRDSSLEANRMAMRSFPSRGCLTITESQSSCNRHKNMPKKHNNSPRHRI
ncbi:hypothetical protein QBC46DRAFT_390287 [Diplogelasinospora grovesii]|uniref:Uncharacterized protein n=1 Tax=Diplogelasinospora grovesii TaxID=303347 RepID=A0AAN6N6R8_9PEZI|nr:hypothetical protein QBC46DRAFT_390287 [Diplogelasinospora grovesii]